MPVAALASAMSSCQGAYYDGVLRIICAGTPEVVLIAGVIDQARYLGLVSTLEDLVDPGGDVRVNLAELAYCDVAGLRAILRLAGTGREDQGHNGRSLFLDDVPLHLAILLRILGWDSAPGLNMTEAAQPAAGPSGMAPAGLVSGGAAMALATSGSAPGSGRCSPEGPLTRLGSLCAYRLAGRDLVRVRRVPETGDCTRRERCWR